MRFCTNIILLYGQEKSPVCGTVSDVYCCLAAIGPAVSNRLQNILVITAGFDFMACVTCKKTEKVNK